VPKLFFLNFLFKKGEKERERERGRKIPVVELAEVEEEEVEEVTDEVPEEEPGYPGKSGHCFVAPESYKIKINSEQK